MCEHLKPLEEELIARGVKETYRGRAWSENCREWVYYDCILDVEKLKKRFGFPDFVIIHENADPKSGLELGLVCDRCNDAIMGLPLNFGKGKIIFE